MGTPGVPSRSACQGHSTSSSVSPVLLLLQRHEARMHLHHEQHLHPRAASPRVPARILQHGWTPVGAAGTLASSGTFRGEESAVGPCTACGVHTNWELSSPALPHPKPPHFHSLVRKLHAVPRCPATVTRVLSKPHYLNRETCKPSLKKKGGKKNTHKKQEERHQLGLTGSIFHKSLLIGINYITLSDSLFIAFHISRPIILPGINVRMTDL